MDYIDPVTLINAFGELPLLKRVCVQGSAPRSFLAALVCRLKAAEKSETAYRTVFFPQLHHIDLEGTDFDAARHPRSILIDELLDCLMERCERKAEVQVLRLDNCSFVSCDVVQRLCEIVVDVGWDGILHWQGLADDDGDYDSEGNIIDCDY